MYYHTNFPATLASSRFSLHPVVSVTVIFPLSSSPRLDSDDRLAERLTREVVADWDEANIVRIRSMRLLSGAQERLREMRRPLP